MSTSRRPRFGSALIRIAMLGMLGATTACGGGGSSPSPVPHPSPYATPTPTPAPVVQTESGALTIPTTGNPGPRIAVALAGGGPTSILVDTGSTGLRLLPSALALAPASSYHDTGTPSVYAYGSGNVYYGTVGVANPGVTLGNGITFTTSFNFEIVKEVCANVPAPAPSSPPANCTNITTAAESDTGGGIIGLRPVALTNVQNPLAELQSPLNGGFVISYPKRSLTVGATAANQTGFATVPTGTSTAPDGSPVWTNNAVFPWCYAVTTPSGASVSACPTGDVLSDTGGLDMNVTLQTAPPSGVTPNVDATLPPSSTVVATITQAGSPSASITWQLTTGSCKPANAPQFYFSDPSASPAPVASPPSSTNGVTPFFSNDVLYDLKAGYFGFRPEPQLPYSNCAT